MICPAFLPALVSRVSSAATMNGNSSLSRSPLVMRYLRSSRTYFPVSGPDRSLSRSCWSHRSASV